MCYSRSMDYSVERQEVIKEKLTPPSHSDLSALANGVTNGAALFGVPILLWNIVQKKPSKYQLPASIFATVTGCAAGAWYGLQEASKTNEYRTNVCNEIIQLRADVDSAKSWAEKQQQRDEKPAASAPSV